MRLIKIKIYFDGLEEIIIITSRTKSAPNKIYSRDRGMGCKNPKNGMYGKKIRGVINDLYEKISPPKSPSAKIIFNQKILFGTH